MSSSTGVRPASKGISASTGKEFPWQQSLRVEVIHDPNELYLLILRGRAKTILWGEYLLSQCLEEERVKFLSFF